MQLPDRVLSMTAPRNEALNPHMPTRPHAVHALPLGRPPNALPPRLGGRSAQRFPGPAERLRARLLEILGELEFEDVVEIGDGVGFPREALFPQRSHVWTCRLDSSRFRSKGAELGTPTLPFGDDSTDLIIASGILMRVPPPLVRGIIEEMSRITRHYVVLVDWFRLPSSGVLGGPSWVHDYPTPLADAELALRNVILLEGGSQRLYLAEKAKDQAIGGFAQPVACHF